MMTAEMAMTAGSVLGRFTARSAAAVACVLLMCALGARQTEGLVFSESPRNVTVAVGSEVSLSCLVKSLGHPPIRWLHNGENLPEGKLGAHFSTHDYAVSSVERQHVQLKSSLKITSVQRALVGRYQCVAGESGEEELSDEGWLMVEGLPSFTHEPQETSVLPGEPFNLTCVAVGPPEPVVIAWYRDGNDRLDVGHAASPAVLLVNAGITSTTTYSCHASNDKGTSVSRPARVNVKALPDPPLALSISATTAHSVQLSWSLGFDGHSPVHSCRVQFAEEAAAAADDAAGDKNVTSSEVEIAGSSSSSLQGHTLNRLAAMTGYSVRVACANEVGLSPWSAWIRCNTSEGVPSAAPTGLAMEFEKDMLIFRWDALDSELTNGVLLGYRLLCWYNDKHLVNLDVGRSTRAELNITDFVGGGGNYTARVLAYTGVGVGPQGPAVYISLPRTEATREPARPTSWTAILVACVATVLLGLAVFALLVLRRRRQDTFFGNAFGPGQDSEEPLVRYQVKKSYSKRSMKATLQRLGISEELNLKLKDVMLDRRLLSLGKVLGEGEFGSVIEGKLKKHGDTEVKVAVKTMKMDICFRGDMDDFLSEAVRMMEFDHPNVIRLLGVCMSVDEQRRLPRPMVVLPFMRHGDLHSYLLRSRIGEIPVYVPMQMLVRFMVDVAHGMEYLSSRHFIHRDLAARNCMLHEDMTVCVADFGLSKKIYSGDYYRQGQISKMPVKWIAIESMADRLYTSKSDVWAFGVTMWEIVTWGKMPYPGIQNHEMYEYLLAGNRLKQPASCLNELYSIMWSCWLTEPSERPDFSSLRLSLEGLLEGLPHLGAKEDVLYANMEPSEALGADGGAEGGAPGWHDAATLPAREADDKPARAPRKAAAAATAAGGGGRGDAADGAAGGAPAPKSEAAAKARGATVGGAGKPPADAFPADPGDVCDGAASQSACFPVACGDGGVVTRTVVAALVHSDARDAEERDVSCRPAAAKASRPPPPPLDLDRYTEPAFVKGEAPAGGAGGQPGGTEAAKPPVPSRGASVEEVAVDDYSLLVVEEQDLVRTGNDVEGDVASKQQR
ncbi:tyrosine-protein kinase receptor UFO-like [Lethenteron reissneri]|uniref:tyrosine-protein kinase receptor UFO-like n=1 Tax=Lethenteron reissneri TaxID=7753 RepID=UPI002AB6E6C1|nr:tyrosine-protein kinase receptor UFO-like [Lethenteron reissneri]XP_061415390.1 tyrosine-protein kinase receptor UFO-like [Lethenteron reissneri]